MGDLTRPLRIVYLIDSLGAGGAERSTAMLLPLLRTRGADVSVVTLYTAAEGSEDSTRAAGIPVTVLSAGGFVARVRALRRILRDTEPDILHTALFSADQVGRLAAVGLNTRVVSSFVNVPRIRAGAAGGGPAHWKIALVNLVDAITCHLFVDRFHAVTPGVASLHERAYRLSRSRISVVERGRPAAELGERTAERRGRVRSALGYTDETPMVIAAGRLEHQKAHVDLISAMRVVAREVPNAVLLIAGREGSASLAVRSELEADPTLAEHVRLLGNRDDVPDLLAAADVMALPSRFEGTAGIALEAMAVGTPIVSTRLEGMVGILVHERNSLIVEVGDIQAMASAITRVLSEPELGERLASQARENFLERFTLDRSADRMLAMYTELVHPPTGAQQLTN